MSELLSLVERATRIWCTNSNRLEHQTQVMLAAQQHAFNWKRSRSAAKSAKSSCSLQMTCRKCPAEKCSTKQWLSCGTPSTSPLFKVLVQCRFSLRLTLCLRTTVKTRCRIRVYQGTTASTLASLTVRQKRDQRVQPIVRSNLLHLVLRNRLQPHQQCRPNLHTKYVRVRTAATLHFRCRLN